jgi:Prohead core protein serine protease
MLLITEHKEDNIQTLVEDAGSGKKNYFIRGIFMESELVNKNGRRYPSEIMEREVNNYNKNYIETSRSLGELGHPQGPTLNLDRVCHIIKEMKMDGNIVYGKAKILDTPYGNIVKNLIDEGVRLGVSSRGMGSLKQVNGINEVQDDFSLATVDIVADPSAPNAFVNGIMEGKEWVWNNGILQEKQIASYKKTIKKANVRELEEAKLEVFKDFISKL